MTLLEIVATLLVLSAVFGLFNHKYLKLPHTVGLVVMGLAASMAIVAVEALWPQLHIGETVRPVLASIDFRTVLLGGFLSALLFAGAVQINLAEMADQKWAIALLSTFGVLISTAVVGVLTWAMARTVGTELPIQWALVFGALISPTDPVAVLALMKHVRVPNTLQTKIAGESLLNDGVGVVVFTILLAIATEGSHHEVAEDAYSLVRVFIEQAAGGLILGIATGYIAYALLRTLDERNIETMITMALVAATYALAMRLGLSGPIAVVAAGVLIGNHGARFAMSPGTREQIFNFWELVDELLNSLLFLLIGLNVLLVSESFQNLWLALAAVPIVLFARLFSVAIPIGVLRPVTTFSRGTIAILTWSGLRGGISVALALSLPETPYRGVILSASYLVVVFSIIVQGLTMNPLVRRYYPNGIS